MIYVMAKLELIKRLWLDALFDEKPQGVYLKTAKSLKKHYLGIGPSKGTLKYTTCGTLIWKRL